MIPGEERQSRSSKSEIANRNGGFVPDRLTHLPEKSHSISQHLLAVRNLGEDLFDRYRFRSVSPDECR